MESRCHGDAMGQVISQRKPASGRRWEENSKKVPGVCGTGKLCSNKSGSLRCNVRAARFQTEAPKIFPSTKVDKRFVNEQTWTAIVQRPAKMGKEWCLRHLSNEIMRCFHDFWGWAERSVNGGGKPIMTGFMRVDAAAIEGLLAASGRDGWFVEPLKRLEEYPEACQQPSPVKCTVREQEEDATRWASRSVKDKLAVRLGQQEGPVCDRRTWQVSGVPKEWQELNLMEVLEKAGMLAPKMLKRFHKKESTNWVVTATVEAKDFNEIQAREHLIFVTPAAGPGLRARTIMRKVAQTGMTFSKNWRKQPKAWHQPVEQPSSADKQGHEQMVPVLEPGPPTKKVGSARGTDPQWLAGGPEPWGRQLPLPRHLAVHNMIRRI